MASRNGNSDSESKTARHNNHNVTRGTVARYYVVQREQKKGDGNEHKGYGRALGLGMVDILVGPLNEPVRVHKNLLCSKFPYFYSMFNKRSKQAPEQTLNLPNEDPAAFDLLIEWVYAGTLPPNNNITGEILIKLYGLAAKVHLSSLMDQTMSYLVEVYVLERFLSGEEDVNLAYQVTSPQSPLRTFMARSLIYVTEMGKYNISYRDSWPSALIGKIMSQNEELCTDIITELRFRSSHANKPTDDDICEYHVHTEDEECFFGLNL